MKFLLFAIVFSALLVAGCVQQPSVSNQNESGVRSAPSPTPPVPQEFLTVTLGTGETYNLNPPSLVIRGSSDSDYNFYLSSPEGSNPILQIDLWSYETQGTPQTLETGGTYDFSFGGMRVRLVKNGVAYTGRDNYQFLLTLDTWPPAGQLATGTFEGILASDSGETVTVNGNFVVARPAQASPRHS